jgi:GNAT superfamily N-acetyltransferase
MSEVRVRDADQPGDLGWIVQAHGELYAQEYGWDVTFEELVASIVGTFATRTDRDREAAWIAELDGERVGCILCTKSDDPTVAKLRLLLVTGAARGHGVGSTLVDRCIAFARSAGYGSMTLWTNDVLSSARRIYEAAGFALAEEEPHHSFGHDLVGQNWTLDFTPGGRRT